MKREKAGKKEATRQNDTLKPNQGPDNLIGLSSALLSDKTALCWSPGVNWGERRTTVFTLTPRPGSEAARGRDGRRIKQWSQQEGGSAVGLNIIKSSSVGSHDGLWDFALFSWCACFQAWLWWLAWPQANKDFLAFSVWIRLVVLLLSALSLLLFYHLQNFPELWRIQQVGKECFPVTELFCPSINWELVQGVIPPSPEDSWFRHPGHPKCRKSNEK